MQEQISSNYLPGASGLFWEYFKLWLWRRNRDFFFSHGWCVRMFHVSARFGEHKEAESNKYEKKEISRILQQIRILMDIGSFPAINKQENDKRCIKSPMCRAKQNTVSNSWINSQKSPIRSPGVSFKCQACHGEPSCASSSTN